MDRRLPGGIMANARIIRRNFFSDPLIAAKYDIQQRFLLIGLACASDDFGRFYWNGNNLKANIYPLDNKQGKWIENQLIIFQKDGLLCQYEAQDFTYGHFLLWFDKSFALKQQLNHPKPDRYPDCNIHKMNDKNTRTLRETSPPNKTKLIKSNKIEGNTIEDNKSKHSVSSIEIEQQNTEHDYDTFPEFIKGLANSLKSPNKS